MLRLPLIRDEERKLWVADAPSQATRTNANIVGIISGVVAVVVIVGGGVNQPLVLCLYRNL